MHGGRPKLSMLKDVGLLSQIEEQDHEFKLNLENFVTFTSYTHDIGCKHLLA